MYVGLKQPRGDGERYVTPARAAAKETRGRAVSNKAVTGVGATFYQRFLRPLYFSCSPRSQTSTPTSPCFAVASLAFSFTFVNTKAVNSLGER